MNPNPTLVTRVAVALHVDAPKPRSTRITLTCNECGKRWKVSPSSDPQCPRCNGADYEVVSVTSGYVEMGREA